MRIALHSVADAVGQPERHVNLWVDRKVDPDAPVSPGPLGPTRYASLCAIAEAAECDCYVLQNVVLVGRPAWVDAVVQWVAKQDDSVASKSAPDVADIDVQWPPLTTPGEALNRIPVRSLGPLRSTPGAALPHDLWPGVQWIKISPVLARQLIAAQFLSPGSDAEGLAAGASELGSESFARGYRFPGSTPPRESLEKVDPQATLRNSGGQSRLTGSLAAHRWYCRQLLSSAPGVEGNAPDGLAGQGKNHPLARLKADRRTFSLTVQNEPAGKVLRSLLGSAGVACDFAADANQGAQQLVSVAAVDQTLWQLVVLIAEKASLKIHAADGKLILSGSEGR